MEPFANSSIHAYLLSDSMLTAGPELDAHGAGLNDPYQPSARHIGDVRPD